MSRLTFGQANGYEPLPVQAQLQTMSDATLAATWRLIHDWMMSGLRSANDVVKRGVQRVLRDWWVDQARMMIDEAPATPQLWENTIKKVMQSNWLNAYNFMQYLLNHQSFPPVLKGQLAAVLVKTNAAYRVVENEIVPFSSEEEHSQLLVAMRSAKAANAHGVKAHLQKAGVALSNSDWAGAVLNSISAVEGATKFASGEDSKDLSAALNELKRQGKIAHPALIEGLKRIYGYSSDEKGVRHALVFEGKAAVTEREAFLLFGLCASFVTYLLSIETSG